MRDGEIGFLVRGDDAEELCDRLTVLITDESLRAEMGENAVRHAADYSWRSVADKLVEVYASLGVENGHA